MLCRDRFNVHEFSYYKQWSCLMCYWYLFQGKLQHSEFLRYGDESSWNGTLVQSDGQQPQMPKSVPANFTVDTVCQTLSSDECERWKTCCSAAVHCCEKHPHPGGGSQDYCPGTWDGYACWDPAPTGMRIYQYCPTFIQHVYPTAMAYKDCDENGTWWRNPLTNMEWTFYGDCVQIEIYRSLLAVKLTCSVLSIALLLPILIATLADRKSRGLPGGTIRAHFLTSFVFNALANVLWDALVYYDRLVRPTSETLMYKNTGSCKALYIFTRYFRCTNFFWMFCEGLFLHNLVVRAPRVFRSILAMLMFAWGGPMIPMGVYCIMRYLHADDRMLAQTSDGMELEMIVGALERTMYENCWVKHAGNFEWIIYTPNLLCLVCNVIFLSSLLKTFLQRIKSQATENASYRRALRATVTLVPLFGIQLAFIIYRPSPDAKAALVYEYIASIVINSQGFLVAAIFCIFNGMCNKVRGNGSSRRRT